MGIIVIQSKQGIHSILEYSLPT